jgi:hypothetical protein
MAALTDFIINWGEVVELDFPKMNLNLVKDVLDKHPGWKPYQPHKTGYNRFGLSVTSLDGQYSGEPDLYSLREWQSMTGESYNEMSFRKRTNIVQFLPELDQFLNFWEPNLGRTHFLRLDRGGFFPPHRDNGAIVAVPTFRIIVPIYNFGINDMKWIQDEKIQRFDLGATYFVNTSRLHSVFSFVDNCLMLVLNVNTDEHILGKMVKKIVAI